MLDNAALRIVVAALSLLAPATAATAQGAQTLSFAVIGDLAYAPSREPQLQAVMAEIDAAPLAFVVHLGDLAGPRAGGSCTDGLWQRRLAQFQSSAHPLIYTPGDNEWTDCHDQQGVPGGDPLERLDALRRTFFAEPRSFGRRTLPLTRQSDLADFATFRENARWEAAGITFLSLHVVGSNNGLGRTAPGDAEHAARTAANLAWLASGFAEAKARGSRAVMIFQQANMFPGLAPFPESRQGVPSGLEEIRVAVAREAATFAKPVVVVHGDTHYFRIDKPFMIRRGTDPIVPNLTRLEGFGDPFHHWVQVDAEADNTGVFVFRERIVKANAGAGR